MHEPGLRHIVWRTLRSPVPPGYHGWLAFGWMILLLFLVQIGTGILLSFYYQPSPETASESVRYLMRDVDYGWLVRGAHHWAGVGILVLGVLQFLRVFIQGTYRGARAANWCIGLVLMTFMLLFAFTGDLLTWDQKAYWVLDAALRRVAELPLIGPSLALAVRGGAEVTGATLSRVYSTHVMLLPWITFFLVLLNLWLLSQGRTRRQEGDS